MPLTGQQIYSFTHLLIYLFTYLLIYLFTYLLIFFAPCLLGNSTTHPSAAHPLNYSSTHLLISSFDHLWTLLCTFTLHLRSGMPSGAIPPCSRSSWKPRQYSAKIELIRSNTHAPWLPCLPVLPQKQLQFMSCFRPQIGWTLRERSIARNLAHEASTSMHSKINTQKLRD